MKVRMLETVQGSNDGIKTLTFEKGRVYKCPSEISDYLVNGWLQRGFCEPAEIIREEVKIFTPNESKYGAPRNRVKTPMPPVKPPKTETSKKI